MAETAEEEAAMTRDNSLLGRRALLHIGVAAFAGVATWHFAGAQPAGEASPRAPVEQLDDALLATMKAGASMSFEERYRALEPVIVRIFNLDEILAASISLSWASIPTAEKADLARAFRHYIVSSYVANFNSYNGQSLEVLPLVRTISNDEVVVQTRLLRTNDSPVKLDYIMRRGPAGWQAVDVLTDGSISRVAVQRSDFRQLLESGGVSALATALNRKVAALSGGTVT
jgi:phospholipid transport system substrate-binding protein